VSDRLAKRIEAKQGQQQRRRRAAPSANGHGLARPAAVEIIRNWFRQHYRPAYKRGTMIVCADGSELPMTVAVACPTSELIERLSAANDAPRDSEGHVRRQQLPQFFARWARPAWGDLLQSLPDEDGAELADLGSARDTFRRLVRDAMLTHVSLGEVVGPGGTTRTERRSLADWLHRFSKPGPWHSLRSFKCWCKRRPKEGGEYELVIAVRVELFAQVKADRRLCEMGAITFSRRCERYGVGSSSRKDRPGGQSAVVLSPEFTAELIGGIPDDGEATEEKEYHTSAHVYARVRGEPKNQESET
jgi:hypothetical protein